MSLYSAVILGFLQGAAEFLPVSSSGHLVLGQHFLGISMPGILFEVFLHCATMASVLFVYRRRIAALLRSCIEYLRGSRSDSVVIDARLAIWILFASFFTGIAVFLLRRPAEDLFEDPVGVSVALLITGAVLVGSRFSRGVTVRPMSWWAAAAIGLTQGVAVIPGLSRSGLTIVTALFFGIERERAVEFSFLLSLPAIAAATLLKILEGFEGGGSFLPVIVAMLVAFLVGVAAIHLVVAWVRGNRFWLWSLWCFLVGAAGLFLLP